MQPESRTPVDGGPAFPGVDWTRPQVQTTVGPYGQPLESFAVPSLAPGMSLRDWLAAQAPVGVPEAISVMGGGLVDWGKESDRAALFAVLALLRFEWADAMLAVRSKPAA